MQKQVTVFLLLLSTIFSACSKDPLSPLPPTTSHKLIFNPDTLRGVQYQVYGFRARVVDLPLSDFNIEWSFFDSGNQLIQSSSYNSIMFSDAGTYKVKAKAFDSFTDSLIVEDSTAAIIAAIPKFAKIVPKSVDTVLQQNLDGSLELFSMFVNTGQPNPRLQFRYHLVGTNVDSIINTQWNNFQYIFHSPGTYTLYVEVLDSLGQLYGRDTAIYNFRTQSFELSALQGMTKVSFMMNIDYTAPEVDSPFYNQLLSMGLSLRQSASNSVVWVGNQLSIKFDSLNSRINDNDRFSLFLASDLKSITSMNVDVHDSQTVSGVLEVERWGCSVKNLKLLSVTSNGIVYVASDITTDRLSPDVFNHSIFNGTPHGRYYDQHPANSYFYNELNSIRDKKISTAYIIFSR